MKRRIAVVGDHLTSGGVILPYNPALRVTFHTHQAALIGGAAFCETCKSAGFITKAGGPRRIRYLNHQEVALHGDIVLCNCATPPSIIAVLAKESWFDDEHSGAGVPLQTASRSSNRESALYDEQVILVDRTTGEPLANFPYHFSGADGVSVRGRTAFDGSTLRVKTENAQSLNLEHEVGKDDGWE